MRLTRRGEYALRAMVDLAGLEEGALAPSHDIALRQEIPPKFLPQIVNELAREGLILTARGAAGGVRLAKAPEDISVSDVIEAVEGPIALNECLVAERPCARKAGCPLGPVWDRAQRALLGVLASTTLDQLADGTAEGRRDGR